MTIKISEVFPKLTVRQREVCLLLVLGYSNKRVGQIYGISPRTVEDHRYAIMKAAEAVNMAEVIYKVCGSPEVAL